MADRGMVSREVIQGLEARGVRYILGMRLRRDKEVREEVLSRPGRYRVVAENLRVKEVWVEGRRYILCYNPQEAEREAMERGLILETLREKLSQGPKALVGNRGFRRYLVAEKGTFKIDLKKVKKEARYDGKWVLRTNTELPAAEVALQYKRLLLVEEFFRAALVLMHELEVRLGRKGMRVE